MAKKESYHEKAQKYITSAKKKGMTVKAEGEELIAYPKGYKKKKSDNLFEKARKKIYGLK